MTTQSARNFGPRKIRCRLSSEEHCGYAGTIEIDAAPDIRTEGSVIVQQRWNRGIGSHRLSESVECRHRRPPTHTSRTTASRESVAIHRSTGHNTRMRFSLIDVLFMSVCFTIGAFVGHSLSSYLPGYFRLVAALSGGLCVYLALVYPFYRRLKLFPMVLPRCPCCGKSQPGFHILSSQWPRVSFRCPTCDGEFVVWHNGKPGDQETWEFPVVALRWPYAFGRFQRVSKPRPGAPRHVGCADIPPASTDSRSPPGHESCS